MKNLRLSVIVLAIGLSIFYNIERLDFGVQNFIDIDSFVYGLGLIAVITTIWVPVLQRLNLSALIVGWFFIYQLSKLSFWLFFDGHPPFGGVYTYLTITEISLLLILVWLAHRVATPLQEFTEAVESITFTNTNNRIKPINEADEEIQIEMFRSRHNHHPLSVVLVELEPESLQAALNRAVQEVQQTMLSNYVINNIAHTLSKYLRRTDLILEQRDQGRFLIMCPDTTAGDLKLLVEYIQAVTAEQLGTSIACGVATFPDEAITFEELVNRAESHLHNLNGHGYLP